MKLNKNFFSPNEKHNFVFQAPFVQNFAKNSKPNLFNIEFIQNRIYPLLNQGKHQLPQIIFKKIIWYSFKNTRAYLLEINDLAAFHAP